MGGSVEEDIVMVVQAMCTNEISLVRVNGTVSEEFVINVGIPQG